MFPLMISDDILTGRIFTETVGIAEVAEAVGPVGTCSPQAVEQSVHLWPWWQRSRQQPTPDCRVSPTRRPRSGRYKPRQSKAWARALVAIPQTGR